MRDSERKRLFRLFAQGKTPEQVVGLFGGSASDSAHSGVNLRRAEVLLEEYLLLPMSKKLRATLMPECVSNRAHRLMDDIADLKLVDEALLKKGDEKRLASLLDTKRKIKERMAKEFAAEGNGTAAGEENVPDSRLDEVHERVKIRTSATSRV